MKKRFKKKLMWSRLNWAAHVERMGDEKLAKRAEAEKLEGKGGEETRNCDVGLH